MTIKINGRVPRDIKKGLRCISEDVPCVLPCAYSKEPFPCAERILRDIKEYIQHLEKRTVELNKTQKQLERERDAAVERLARYRKCIDCKRYPEVIKNLYCDDCECGSKWKWRGIQEVE